MFAGALLLVSLTLLGQRNEGEDQAGRQPSVEHIELQADLCSSQAAEASISLKRYDSGARCEFRSGNQLLHEYLKGAAYQIRMKNQMHIHLKLKPLIGYKSCLYLQHVARSEEPPVC